jgi:tellurite resistance protein TerC
MTELGLWILFGVIVSVALAVDLGLKSHRHRTQPISLREAALWTSLWVSLAMLFAGTIAWTLGRQRALEYLTGYLLEESLSVDNMFVFVLIFEFFRVPAAHQPRVLKYGILGAVVMRFVIIFTGVALVQRYQWIFYGFGILLIVTAIQLMLEGEKEVRPDENWMLRLFKRFVPVSAEFHEDHFFVRRDAGTLATPLFAALVVVEASDLVFAMDSIPAVLAVSNHPLIVFTSNIFAILGLRALYFLVSGFVGLFRFLRYGLGLVLVFIGVKMLITSWVHIRIAFSLGVVAVVLALSVFCSVLFKEKSHA